MEKLTLSIAAGKIRNGSLSCLELAKSCLAEITARDERLNAICHLNGDLLGEAAELDREAARGDLRGPLHGLPLAVKDNIDVRGMPSTVGSPIFRHAPAVTRDSVAVARLRAAGALIIGKANMDELAAHISGITSCHGPAVNPRDDAVSRSPGGSSSGTAVAVAGGLCLGGLGTDTGGSIRIPACWCGICGLRTTFGHVSSFGVFPRGASLDAVSLLSLDLTDMNLLFRVVAGNAGEGSAANPGRPPEETRIAVFSDFACSVDEPDICANFELVVKRWADLGAKVEERRFPEAAAPELGQLSNTIRAFEFARDVGPYIEASPHKGEMHPLVLQDYHRGLATGYDEYLAALGKMQQLRARLAGMFEGVDFLLAPVTAIQALPLDAPLSEFAIGRRFMDFGSLAGIPTLVHPTGLDRRNLPLGVQLMGRHYDDFALIAAGLAYEAEYS